MSRFILATNNVHKISEMKAILEGLDIEILSARNFPDFPIVEETGVTLAENATLKARAVWEKYHLPSVADDTGLEVDFLDGAPGVFSSRFAGESCTYDDNNRKLLGLLEGVLPENRTARFKTAIAFIDQHGKLHMAEGILNGQISTQMMGKFGFGYDPIFLVNGAERTLAQFASAEKNKISHRGRALAMIRPVIIKSLLG